MTPSNQELVQALIVETRNSVQAAAYVLYLQLKPANKQLLTQRQFHEIFKDNWMIFAQFEEEEQQGCSK